MKVGKNLWVALWHFRRIAEWNLLHHDAEQSEFGDYEHIPDGAACSLTAKTPIWIDALCINQVDGSEKKEQIRHMGKLYEQASCVHTWLGPSFPDSELAFELEGNKEARIEQRALKNRERFAPPFGPWAHYGV